MSRGTADCAAAAAQRRANGAKIRGGGNHMNHPAWRRTLRRELAWLMTLKVAALALLWWLFFSPAHHSPVDGRAASRRFAVAHPALIAPTANPAGREGSDD